MFWPNLPQKIGKLPGLYPVENSAMLALAYNPTVELVQFEFMKLARSFLFLKAGGSS